MKKQAATAGLILATTCLLTACGTTSAPTSVPSETTSSNSSGNQTNTTTGSTSTKPIQLAPFSDAKQVGIDVQVPVGWDESPVSGGDYSGWKFTNPNNSSDVVTIVSSTCVGCYMDASGNPDPTRVIPSADQNVQTTKKTNGSVVYTFTHSGNVNSGQGKLITSTDKTGYGYVETTFGNSQQTAASDILNSFSLTR